MGNIFSIKEELYTAVECSNLKTITNLIKEHPLLLNTHITDDSQVTALGRACWRGDLSVVELLLGADVNYDGPKGITPMMWACKSGHNHILEYLIECKANVYKINLAEDFNALDYAIIHGNYKCALTLCEKFEDLLDSDKSIDIYQAFAQKLHYRWVNYEVFMGHLHQKVPEQAVPNFFSKPKKPRLVDPVIDPREKWKDFFKRTLEFEDPPMVERDQLPADLQPQNRTLGKLSHYINGLSPYPRDFYKKNRVEEEHSKSKDVTHPDEDVILNDRPPQNMTDLSYNKNRNFTERSQTDMNQDSPNKKNQKEQIIEDLTQNIDVNFVNVDQDIQLKMNDNDDD